MKQLYKKIYEAINTGIQKALSLDDTKDVSIIYQHKKIVNNVNLMPYYVEELLSGFNMFINYEQIIKYYKETGYTYKVKNFNELRNIFNKIYYIKNVSFEWISNIKDYISIILADDSEKNFYEKTDKKPLFLKFANDDILNTKNEILIYIDKNHYIPRKTFKWQTETIQIQSNEYLINMKKYGTYKNAIKIAEKDYSGYETCLRIQDIVQKDPEKYGEIPTIDYCLNLNNIKGYQGYLPSIGQLKILSDNIDMINYIFKYLKLNEIKDFKDIDWWSSTEYIFSSSWYLNNGNIYDYSKNEFDTFCIFPLFAKIKN
ncbi:MAG: hypothetical protein [Wendovervirus sonii]|uniref:Virion structural protein n=1 Tax=phage Lak_Megaphage_Sonny TaxID=3109229 RepID=A0ABZ0Z3Y9_9CAUD|nr:MAG: hypothetical protein [phage Lak_Megaphage_Sonny]